MNEKEPKETIIRLEPLQFHNLLNTIDNLTKELRELKELKNITARLTALEAELKLLRMEISELKQKK
jgi:FtsZ-binding cell division protein ZapB